MENNFWKWYNSTSEKAGSLVTPASAAEMIGISRQYLEKLVIAGKIKKYYFEDKPFIGMNDINREKSKRQEKIISKNKPEILLIKAEIERRQEEIERIRNDAMEESNSIVEDDDPEKELQEAIDYLNFLNDCLEKEQKEPFSSGYDVKFAEESEE